MSLRVNGLLTECLRDSTRYEHARVEALEFPQRVLRSEASFVDWANLLASLLPVYRVLEEGLEAEPRLAGLRLEGLARAASIEADLAALQLRGYSPTRVASRAYVDHLRSLARLWPLLLATHAWLRYLGDLSGGRMLASALTKHPGLTAKEMGFFRFDTASPRALQVALRAQLDALPLSVQESAALVAEARRGFAFNGAILRALG